MPERPSRTLSLLLIALAATLIVGVVHAQPPNDDCASALILCAQQPLTGNNTGAVGPPGFCPSTGAALWYTFTTNSVGGTVDITVDGIDCPVITGMDNELSVVVLSGDGSCTLGSFSAASTCEQDSQAFTLTTGSLAPSTQYCLLISGVADNGATQFAQCGFSITASGPGMNIVNVDFDAGPNAQIPQGGSTQLQAVGGTTYVWSPTSGLSGNTIPDPVAQPEENTIYTVTTTLNGCTYSDSVIVEVLRLIDPQNMISPNGDGINDTWDIPGINTYPQADVSIYDRWGQRVFHSVGYNAPFDGKDLPTATYYWHIDLNRLEGRSAPYTGYLTIVR